MGVVSLNVGFLLTALELLDRDRPGKSIDVVAQIGSERIDIKALALATTIVPVNKSVRLTVSLNARPPVFPMMLMHANRAFALSLSAY